MKKMLSLGLILFMVSISIQAPPPNIIFILADDLGYGDLGTYWNNNTHGRIKTPNLDRMASEGTRWTQVYAGDTVCAPSRCALMTGKHTAHARIRGNQNIPLSASDVTVAQVLKKANYSTAIIGKWGLGDNGTTGVPNKKGFDLFFGYLDQGAAHDYYPATLFENEKEVAIKGNNKTSHTTYSHDLFANLSLSWVTEQARQPYPFFLYLAFTIPHAGGIGTTDETAEPVPSSEPYTNQTWPAVEKDFAAMITRMDKDIGNLFQLLVTLGIDNKTVVFFASDNGAHNEGGHNHQFFDSSGPLRGFKRSMYDGGIRAPMIVRWPNVVPKGKVDNDSIWAFWDVFPTLTEIAGIPANNLPPGLDGTSRLPTILGRQQPQPEYLYWEFCCNSNFTTAIRVNEWKGVKWSLNGPLELYNLTSDVGEGNNVASKNPAVVDKLNSLLKQAHVESTEFPSNPCIAGC